MPNSDIFPIELMLMKIFFIGLAILNIISLVKPNEMKEFSNKCTKVFYPFMKNKNSEESSEENSESKINKFKRINIVLLIISIIALITLQILF